MEVAAKQTVKTWARDGQPWLLAEQLTPVAMYGSNTTASLILVTTDAE